MKTRKRAPERWQTRDMLVRIKGRNQYPALSLVSLRLSPICMSRYDFVCSSPSRWRPKPEVKARVASEFGLDVRNYLNTFKFWRQGLTHLSNPKKTLAKPRMEEMCQEDWDIVDWLVHFHILQGKPHTLIHNTSANRNLRPISNPRKQYKCKKALWSI